MDLHRGPVLVLPRLVGRGHHTVLRFGGRECEVLSGVCLSGDGVGLGMWGGGLLLEKGQRDGDDGGKNKGNEVILKLPTYSAFLVSNTFGQKALS